VLAILITVVVVLAVLGVIYLVGSQPSAKSEKAKRPSRGATASKASRSVTKKSEFGQTPRWVRRLPLALVVAAVICLVVAVAQFRVEQQQGTPVVAIVLDASMSMDAQDVSPSRLVAAQNAAQLFLQKLPEEFDVVLVAFADTPTVLEQATADHAEVSRALGDLPRGEGTVIGDGLSSAIDEITTARAGNDSSPAAIVLLSDGRDTGSTIAPTDAAASAARLGIPVYTVVLGTGAEGTKPPDSQLLTQIATTTGGTVSTASSADQLSTVYESLGSQLSSQLSISSSAQLFVFIAIALAMAAALITIVLALRKQG
jgi:Ca-activated chloride channel family protein